MNFTSIWHLKGFICSWYLSG